MRVLHIIYKFIFVLLFVGCTEKAAINNEYIYKEVPYIKNYINPKDCVSDLNIKIKKIEENNNTGIFIRLEDFISLSKKLEDCKMIANTNLKIVEEHNKSINRVNGLK
jgi:hypothetical protein